ncbi:DEAD/DEAH box helicase [Anaerobacillus isosaccharinicus]|uniref:DEAD/DEAH box helicase n=1 Tax=Anaerobacillus isosaccharinicus TaxID=1532552 RepID=A0A1S2LUD2_9BACI|nr:DEAD/DEAH box helicase [Anaerobacillus isosaccharinicus]MBA5585520.1 DEAD/DEAH box helicase [Anaerobacillus isosaccharinicus]QOY36166.1 DEAD/DEAH box helicase [Anaerobacillus isosaccharinicus]
MSTKSNFERFQLKPFIIEALNDQRFSLPTEIQERLIPAIISGKDVIGQSQTGSGKTLAFLIPILERIDVAKEEVQAVITAPTRELAAQIFSELEKILQFNKSEDEIDISANLIVGGTDRLKTIGKLKTQPHIVVGTPGRVLDMVEEQALKVYTSQIFVVDEADQMLDMGFIEEVDKIASRMGEELQMLVFSATIPEKLQPFLKKYMNNPRHVQVDPQQTTAEKIEHFLLPAKHRDKLKLVVDIAKKYNPYFAIIFANTKEQVDEVANAMLQAGLNVERIHGGLQPRHRKSVMKDVNAAKVQYLVASDLAARGIDIKGVTHIINYELPKNDLDWYIHRVGRSARAGQSGIALSIYEEKDEPSIQKLMDRKIRFTYVDLKNGEFVELENKVRRHVRKTTIVTPTGTKKGTVVANTGGKAKAKPKKVKPSYKKRARWAQEKVDLQNRRKKKK